MWDRLLPLPPNMMNNIFYLIYILILDGAVFSHLSARAALLISQKPPTVDDGYIIHKTSTHT